MAIMITCDRTNCFFCIEGQCDSKDVKIFDNECESWISKNDPQVNPEYRSEYWAACITLKKRMKYRELRKGKRVEINEHVFYLSGDDGYDDGIYTEEKTGYGVGYYTTIKNDINRIAEKMATLPSVMDLPVGERRPDGKILINGVYYD